MNKDLRSFLGEVRQLGPDYFVSISKTVGTTFEPCVIQQKLAAQGKYPVIRCENMDGYDMPLTTNLFGSYELLGLAIGVDPGTPKQQILHKFRERVANPIKPVEIPKEEAPVKQVIWTGDEVDLGKLPITKHAPKDSGHYISVGVLVIRDPDSGVLNAGIYRHEVQGKNKIGAMFNPAHHSGYIYRRHKEMNKPMEAVLFLGHHPATILGSLSRGGIDSEEFDMMGALMGEALEITQAETVDLPVPAWAEIVMEGTIDPNVETSDGPFAEYSGFYGPPKEKIAQMTINAVTMRSDAIYHDLDPAHREHCLAGALTFESQIFDSVRAMVPTTTAVYMPASGTAHFTAYIAIKKNVPGEGMSAGMAAITANSDIKIAIVVDDDIDIYNEEQVLWAISTHFEADRDMAVIPNAMGAHLCPSAYGEIRHEKGPMNTKIIIDATRPATLPFADRIRPDQETWDRINLDDYIDG